MMSTVQIQTSLPDQPQAHRSLQADIGNVKGSPRGDLPLRVLSTLNDDGSRRWLRPRVSAGRFLRARRAVAYFLIALFAVLPFIKINGAPIILIDVPARRFHILGETFLPTDTILLALLLVGIFVFIFLITALLGRLWCGWACPQTVYMEFLYRPIERFFEGSPGRMRSPHTFRGSGTATVLKYGVYFVISLYLAHVFLAYFVGIDQLTLWVQRSPIEHPAGFVIVAATTALMMFDFCYFREQTCILACPYGRFQSVMLDQDSLIIGYDASRGEPRGRIHRQHGNQSQRSQQSSGDCIDCAMCVTTCPTGIDIRDGLQMECIGCAQCIDACDVIMDKVGRQRGLIRYTSQHVLSEGQRQILRPRLVIYPLILLIVSSLFVMVLINRQPANVIILRGLGRTHTELPSGEIANPVRFKITNRTAAPRTYEIVVGDSIVRGRIQCEQQPIVVGPGASVTIPAQIIVPAGALPTGRAPITVVIRDDQDFSTTITWTLVGPPAARITVQTPPNRDTSNADVAPSLQGETP